MGVQTEKKIDGEVVKHRAKLVAKGYVQKQGVDFEEVFALVIRLDTVRLILALVANRGWQVHHLEVEQGSIWIETGTKGLPRWY